MKHTKTPWSIGYNDGKIVDIVSSQGGVIAAFKVEELGHTQKLNAEFIVHAVNMHESLVEALKANAIRFPMEFKTTTKDCTCNQFIDSNSCRHVMALIALKNANVYFGD